MAKILVVDSHEDGRELVRETLAADGHDVSTAATGHEGLTLGQLEFHLVIVDVTAAEVDGWTFIKTMRSWSESALIPAIFLTEEGETGDRLRGYRLKPDAFLAKPFTAVQLMREVERTLRRARRHRSATKMLQKSDAPAFAGKLTEIGVAPLLSMLELEKKTGKLLLDKGDEDASLYLREGQVVQAKVGIDQVTGPDGVYLLLNWTQGTFEYVAGSVEVPDRIRQRTATLLLEGARRIDESG
jgi:DNA-binding response OmpR family regulator